MEKAVLAALIGLAILGLVTRAMRVAVGVVLVVLAALWVARHADAVLEAILQAQRWLQGVVGHMLAGGGQQAAEEWLRRVASPR